MLRALVGGRYEVIDSLGRGAMGVVYKCRDLTLDRIVAVKQIAGEFEQDQRLRQRFVREARAAARLRHPHIVRIYDLHESGDCVSIVMELLDGVDLNSFVRLNVPSPQGILTLLAQLCDALAHAHENGVVHRDIKPANLMVSSTGVLTVVDFGIAHVTSSTQITHGEVIGTPNYMSPELASGQPVDARSDLFAVGVVAYELLSRTKPFVADAVPQLLSKIVSEPHESLATRSPGLSGALCLLVDSLLAKRPMDRPSSAREVRALLSAMANGAEPAVSGDVAANGRSRLTRAATIVTIVVAAVIAGIVGARVAFLQDMHDSATTETTPAPRVEPRVAATLPSPSQLGAPRDAKAPARTVRRPGQSSEASRGTLPSVEALEMVEHPARSGSPVSSSSGRASAPSVRSDGPGSIRILTSPGAEILLDTFSMGRAGINGELQISGLTAGIYVVTVRADGNSVRREVSVNDGHVTDVDARTGGRE